jgi:hypothetical protein
MSDESAIDYGPLAGLQGTWQGDKGLDISPEPEGSEESPYFETLRFEAIGDVKNADSQVVAVLRYQQIVSRQSSGEVFHDQTGYWIWDAERSIVMQSIAIPRGVCVLAGGHWTPGADDAIEILVKADSASRDWGIIQPPFMRDRARTRAFSHELKLERDTLRYNETTQLVIYGRSFEHSDRNVLTRTA